MKELLAAKAAFKAAAGIDWTADYKPPTASTSTNSTSSTAASEDLASLDGQIAQQGDQVRQLKASKAPKADVEAHVKRLLELKALYKAAAGKDWKPRFVGLFVCFFVSFSVFLPSQDDSFIGRPRSPDDATNASNSFWAPVKARVRIAKLSSGFDFAQRKTSDE